MKFIYENLKKFKFILIIIIIVIELIGLTIVINLYEPIYKKTIEITKNYTINKTISTAKILRDTSLLNFNRQLLDLKLTGKHMAFLGKEEDESMYIKRSSNYFKNILSDENKKKIIYGTMEELKKEINDKYYDKEEERYDYFSNYYKKYALGDKSRIMYYLQNHDLHSELDMIAYYKLKGENTEIELEEDKRRAAIYLISILKSIIINRFITKGKNYDLMSFMLFIEDEMFIYPPEAFNNTHVFFISNQYKFNCGFLNAKNNFPRCVYYYINDKKNGMSGEIQGLFHPLLFGEKIYYDNVSMNLCIKIPFEKFFDLYNLTYDPLLCYESNITKFFLGNTFEQKESFEFIFFLYDLPYTEGDIVPIFNGKREVLEEIKTVYDDEKFKQFSIRSLSQYFSHFSLFHILYLDIFKDDNCVKKLTITIDDIIKEYKEIVSRILTELTLLKDKQNKTTQTVGNPFIVDLYTIIDSEKTVCKKDVYNNNVTILKDNFLFIIYPINGDIYYINDIFLEDQRYPYYFPFYYSLSIININDNYIQWKIKRIMIIKIIKLFVFYFIISVLIIIFYFILVRCFYETKYNTIEQISEIINDGLFFEKKDKNEIIKKKESLIEINNKDMAEIKNIFDTMTKSMLFKMTFDEKSNYYNLKSNINKNNNKNINKKSNLNSINEYMDLIKSINNPQTKIMCIYIISYDHFKERKYKLAENEFKNLILDIKIYEGKISNQNDDSDSKLKESISRCSKISYLNEYSLTTGMNETALPIIKTKLLKQKIFYLYALCIYNQEKSKKNNITKDNKKNNEDIKKRYEDAIKYFTECKNISSLLGTDIIREIFSLIMISKCYTELKNYKESMININEALLLFLDLQNSFKDKTYFNPKVMLFTGNYIFQNIMLTMAQITYIFNKMPQSCWILMKIIETSPFVFNSMHYNAYHMLNNCLKQIDNNSISNRQIDKYRKKINKIYIRISFRLLNNDKDKNEDIRTISNNNTNKETSNPLASKTQVNNISTTDKSLNNLRKTNNDKKELFTNKLNKVSMNSSNNMNQNKIKSITLCVSGKTISNINGEELKDVLIKFFQKCFSNNTDEDKFSFIQFSYNGKKTITIKSESLDFFLQKLESNKGAFQVNEKYNKKSNEIHFMEFANLFFSIIKSKNNFDNKYDNIIILFINTEDIRFNDEKECIDTVKNLNNNNYTLIIFTYDTSISDEKIMNIHSFMCGLNDGHFFHIKNYQQIKQVLMNFSNKESQEKFVNYDYEITDYML